MQIVLWTDENSLSLSVVRFGNVTKIQYVGLVGQGGSARSI